MSQIGYQRDKADRRAAARFPARYPGRCVSCGDDIEVGETLRWDDDVAIHANCQPTPEVEPRPTCPKCWTVYAVNGDCGCDQ